MDNIDIENLKIHIINNDLIEQILTKLNFKPKDKGNYYQFANLDGDNPTAISIRKKDLVVCNFTRGYNGDIITLIQESYHIDFLSALKMILDILEYDNFTINKSSYISELIELEKESEKIEEELLPELNENILKKYLAKPNKLWYNEGINVDTQAEFQIMYDKDSECIIIPIRDENNRLVGIKNRKNTSEDVYMKYFYSYPYQKSKILYNLNKSKEYIIESKEVIVVESEKTVMKLWQNGIKNVVAISGADISYNQLLKLERLNVNIVLAFDKGLNNNHIDKQINKFLIKPIVLNQGYELLNNKDSPIDKGLNIFKKIYNKGVDKNLKVW